jgi:hypothetical protein
MSSVEAKRWSSCSRVGDKGTQDRDIAMAIKLAREL